MQKVSWKPLVPTSSIFTSTSTRASRTARGTGTAKTGPIRMLSWTLSSNRTSGHALRHGDVEDRARGLDQLVRTNGAVSVADEPEHQRIAEVLGGDQVEPVALLDGVGGDGGKGRRARLRHDP